MTDSSQAIDQMIVDAAGDRIGGMSLLSLFLTEYESRGSEDKDTLLAALGDILSTASEDRLIACAWLAGALAYSDVRSDCVEVSVRKRLMSMEAEADSLDERDLQALDALRKADIVLYSTR